MRFTEIYLWPQKIKLQSIIFSIKYLIYRFKIDTKSSLYTATDIAVFPIYTQYCVLAHPLLDFLHANPLHNNIYSHDGHSFVNAFYSSKFH